MRRSVPKQRSGISMLELIIVIVILGIVAAIALPRLTHDDTTTDQVLEINAVREAIDNFEGYYHAHHQWDSNISKMTNVPLEYGSGVKGANAIYWYRVNQEWCVEFQLNPHTEPGELLVNVVPGGGCQILYDALQQMNIAGTANDPKIYRFYEENNEK